VRTVHPPLAEPRELRRRVDRLDGLPLRPFTSRFILEELARDPDESPAALAATPRWRQVTDLDPGWVVVQAREGQALEPLRVVAERPWWVPGSRESVGAFGRLWRHAVAVSVASRRLARDGRDPDPDLLGRAGLLHNLGVWAVAAVEPDWLLRWLSTPEGEPRREFERQHLGEEAASLGRTLAERWHLDPLVGDAAWLHADLGLGLGDAAEEPDRLARLQEAYVCASMTPWSLASPDPVGPVHHDPRTKIVIAEVQSRCGGTFLDPDPSPREERLVRDNARLRRELRDLAGREAARDRLLLALATSDPTERPEVWAERAGLAWCGVPGVASARVDWTGTGNVEATPDPPERAPRLELPLTDGARRLATVRLRVDDERAVDPSAIDPVVQAWRAWAAVVDSRARLEARLGAATGALRRRAEDEGPRLRRAKLDALAEFAAGAGHELNNPLAVIVGRAQLLLAGESDPRVLRSLRAILTQAQRAHRILRDLMFVARPPDLRPRSCLPDEIWKISLRDARDEADERGVRLVADRLGVGKRVWADADGLRHLADTLIRNALEATAPGGMVQVASEGDGGRLRWTVRDDGRGITPGESEHLFDPFYCGRQAGRGLGLGLPRAARFVALAGGEIRCRSAPGEGSTFTVDLPSTEPPGPPCPAPGPGAGPEGPSPEPERPSALPGF
jgi:signal transduction histidine kinase